MIEAVSMQRWNEYNGGEKQFQIGTPEAIDENAPDIVKEFYSYYRTKRGLNTINRALKKALLYFKHEV